jgi:hypothetical protein
VAATVAAELLPPIEGTLKSAPRQRIAFCDFERVQNLLNGGQNAVCVPGIKYDMLRLVLIRPATRSWRFVELRPRV